MMQPHYPSDFKVSGLNLEQQLSFTCIQIPEITANDFRISPNCCNLLCVWMAMAHPRQS
jgi:hypothetical protein